MRAYPILGALIFLGCATEAQSGVSESDTSAHGDFVRDNSAFRWADSTYDAFREAAAGNRPPKAPLADSDPIATRLQTWVDEIDGLVRTDFASSHGPLLAPRPVVKVVPDAKTINAWVTAIPVCVQAGKPILVNGPDGNTALVQACLETPPEWASAARFEAYWNASTPSCALTRKDTTLSPSCKSQVGLGVGTLAASPYVHITSGLLALLDERSAVVILAHELGHYYRSHVSPSRKGELHYWYETKGGHAKPTPSARSADLERAYLTVTNSDRYGTFAGRYPSRLRGVLYRIGELLGSVATNEPSCAEARRASDGFGGETDWSLKETETELHALEDALATCAPHVAIADASPVAVGSIARAELAKLVEAFAKELEGELPGATLAEVLDALATRVPVAESQVAGLVDLVRHNQVGLYTAEQEADDIAMDLSVRLGVGSAEEVASTWISLARALQHDASHRETKGDNERSPEPDPSTCESWFHQGFQSLDGTAFLVSLGLLDDPHHGLCYRAFNAWRRAQSLGRSGAAARAPLAPGWDELRARAAGLQ